jgi:ornithine cyclodeaminase/alanine dehydrogenase-like protein (mu-crystallin family)
MLVLSDVHVIELAKPLQLVAAVEAAARAKEKQNALVPARIHIDRHGSTFLTMPAIHEDVFCTKLVSIVPSNTFRGLPVTNGLTVLSDSHTGIPLAVMNAAALTATRTGAVGALGVKYMTPEGTASVGIVGCGKQGTWQAIFACAVRPIVEVFSVSRSEASISRFVTALNHRFPAVEVTACADVDELLARTNVVITATTSSDPVLPDVPSLLNGKHFISIGSFRPGMQELPDSVYRLAGELVIDSDQAAHEVGDVINALHKGILKTSDVFTIGQLLTGRRSVDVNRTTAYKSVGMALFDLFVARVLYDAAKAQGIGQEIAL